MRQSLPLPRRSVLAGLYSLFPGLASAAECGAISTGTHGARALIAQYQFAPFDERFARRVEAILQLPYVQGVSLYLPWRMLEPSEFAYDWYFSDVLFEAAARHRKLVAFGLQAAAVSPDWVKSRASSVALPYPLASVGTRQQPVPWDPKYVRALSTTVRALGSRYDGRAGIAFVTINGPSPLYGLEVNWPMGAGALAPEEEARLGFTLERFVHGWRGMVDTFLAAFPRTPLGLALNNHIDHRGILPGQAKQASEAIRDYALARQAQVQSCLPFTVRLLGLNGGTAARGMFSHPYEGPQSITPYTALALDVAERAQLGYEAARVFARESAHNTPAYTPKQFDRMMRIGVSHHANFIELKLPDLWDLGADVPYEPFAAAIRRGDAALLAEPH